MKIDDRKRSRVSDHGGETCLLHGVHDGGRRVDQSRVVRVFSEVVPVPIVQWIISAQVELPMQDISLGLGIGRPPPGIRVQ